MLTAIDHVMIGVPDLPKAMDAFARIGFDVHHGGVHAGEGTHNAIAFLESDYLELLGVRDATSTGAPPPRRAARWPGSPSSSPGAAASGPWSCRATTWTPTWPACARAASTWATRPMGGAARRPDRSSRGGWPSSARAIPRPSSSSST